MAIEKMKLVQVVGLMENLDKFITSCCISGDFHPENAVNYLSGSLGFVSLNEENPYNPSIKKIEETALIAGVTLKETFNGNEVIIDCEEAAYIDELREHINSMLAARDPITGRLTEITSTLEQFRHFENLDISIDEILSAEFLKVRFGCIPKDCYPKLKAYENQTNVMFVECGSDEKNYWGLYVAPKSEIDEVDRIFATLYFERIIIPTSSGTPAQTVDELSIEKIELEAELKAIDDEIASYWSENSEHCERIYANLKIASLAFDMRKYAAKDHHSDKYYTYVGWVPESSLDWFKERIAEIPDTTYELTEPEQNERSKPPVKLKNKRLIRPFEMFVEMYGLPSYGEVDVTPFVAITYTLLFGMMFADLGQGLVLAIGGYLFYRFKGSKLAKILVPCGASSMVFGTLFGSVFGYEHLLDPVYKAIGLDGKPFEVMDSINTILIFSVSIGIGLVLVSMALNVYCCLRKKKYGEALFSQNGVTGILLYSSLVCAVIAFMAKKTVLPAAVIAVIAAVGILILFFKEILIGKVDKHDKYMPDKWSDYIMQNFFEIIEYILTYFSNTISFLRVGAFVLVHAGMMMVFSSLAGDPTSPGGIAAMVFGNILVIALEGLLTGIQVLRLEFYEMFSRFYEGDGKPFKSIGIKTNRHYLFKTKRDPQDIIFNVNSHK